VDEWLLRICENIEKFCNGKYKILQK
jgi:hypothetical protein